MNALTALVGVLALAVLAFLGTEVAGLHIVFGTILPYLALVLFIGGVVYRILLWAKSPVPFRIPTSCGQQKSLPWIKHSKLDNPYTKLQTVGRMVLEVLFFRSLFRNTRVELGDGPQVRYAPTKWLWAAALAFHWSFLIVLVRHLRFFTPDVPRAVMLAQDVDGFFQVGAPVVYVTTLFLLAAVSFLFLRRIYSPQLRYISLVSDYFPLFLILGIAITGILMRHFIKTDIVGVKQIAMGLLSFQPVAPDGVHFLFYIHFFFVIALFAYFPFSKLMHAGGVFMSPTRNMANNNRAVRHVNPWNYDVHVHTYEEYEDDFREKMVSAGIPVEKE